MVEVESYELRRYLPMPYEAALGPRLLRVQGRAEEAAGWQETCPELLRAVGARLRAGSGALIAVGDGGLGARAVAGRLCSGGEFRLFFPEPVSAALREVLAQTDGLPVSVFVFGPLRDPGTAAFLRLLLDALAARNPRGPACQVAAAAVEGTSLMNVARSQGWEILPVPAAGRFDILTAAGLLPAAAAGAGIESLLQGASDMLSRCREASFENPAWRYAALRYELSRRGRTVEILSSRDPDMEGVLDWWQALFAGAEGKDGKGLLPVAAKAAAGPWGLGQYLQEGRRMMFETVLQFGGPLETPYGRKKTAGPASLPESELDFLREKSEDALLTAHSRAGVPCLRITARSQQAARREAQASGNGLVAAGNIRTVRAAGQTGAKMLLAGQSGAGTLTAGTISAGQGRAEPPEPQENQAADNARTLGELLCFFQFACGLSAGLLDVDPQDCGALETYHKELSGLLTRLRGPEHRPPAGQL